MKRLLVKLTAGADEPELANQALTVAAAAAASGAQVSLWLTGEAVWFATHDRCPVLGLEHATPVEELMDSILALGTVTVCTQCATRRALSEPDLAPGAGIRGAAAFVEEALTDGTQALVY